MSTRCQVQVTQEGLGDWTATCQLYHHTDGYPEHMLPCIAEAYELSGKDWRAGRAGKAASFLCAADPGTFEPEAGHDLHGDIEYYYKLYVVNTKNGSMAEHPRWDIEVFETKREFWDDPSEKNRDCVLSRRELSQSLTWLKEQEEKE